MSAKSDYAEKLVLDWLMTTGVVTRPTAWYLALFTAAPTDAGGGTEVSTFGYARQAIAFDAATSGVGTTQNNNVPAFTAAGGSWGSVTHIGIFDALSLGNLLWHSQLVAADGVTPEPETVNDGSTLTFAIGSVKLTEA